MSNDKTKKTAAALAAAVGISAAAALGLWEGYRAIEMGAGREDPQVVVEREPDEYLAAEVDPGTGPRVVELKARRQHVRAGLTVEVPGLGRALVLRSCGSLKQRKNKCPDLYGPASRCACCCPAGQVVVGDCQCAASEDAGSGEPGALCRNARPAGSPDAGAVCDPDAPGCAPWPCWVYAGDNPGAVYAADKRVDAGG